MVKKIFLVGSLILITFSILTPFVMVSSGNLVVTTGYGEVTTKTYEFDKNFKNTILSLDADVTIRRGNKDSVMVTASKNLQDLINIKETSSTLELSKKDINNLDVAWLGGGVSSINITLVFADIQNITTKDSVDLNILGFQGDDLIIDNQSSGRVNLRSLDLKSLELETTGNGLFTVQGKTNNLKIKHTSPARLDTRQLEAESVEVELMGGGDVSVKANQSLEAKITGSGEFTYFGDVELGNVKIDKG